MSTVPLQQTNGSSESHLTIGPTIRVCQINIEGISRSKSEYIGKLLVDQNVDVITVQETHTADDYQIHSRGRIPGYNLVGAINHPQYGIATYARSHIRNVSIVHSIADQELFCLTIKVENVTIANIYKPPSFRWPNDMIPTFPHPAIYTGDFNSHHYIWGYNDNNEDGERVVDWAERNNLYLLYDAKQKPSFHSGRWNRGYNPDLTFISTDITNSSNARRDVLDHFPKSQHRPIIITLGTTIPIINSLPLPRWNFKKAKWDLFGQQLEDDIRHIQPKVENYERFAALMISAAKKHIPRGVRKSYIPCWDEECQKLYDDFEQTGDPDLGEQLLESLNNNRTSRWKETLENLNFTHSSRTAWNLLRRLDSGLKVSTPQAEIPAPDAISKRIKQLSKPTITKEHKRKVCYQLNEIRSRQQQSLSIMSPVTSEELNAALQQIKCRKAAGIDNIFPEFMKNTGPRVRAWLLEFYRDIIDKRKVPNLFRKCKIIAIAKQGKDPALTSSYRPIALLSVCYKILEKIIYNRLLPIVQNNIPIEQAGFMPGRSCCEQVLSLTTFIENGFQKKQKTAAAFIDLSCAYDTVWKEGLLIKLYTLVPCKAFLQLMNELLSDRLFQVIVNGKKSKFRSLQNGLPQGSVLSPLMFNIYTSDIPITTSRKFMYADDIALATQSSDLSAAENVLGNDLQVVNVYFKKWGLQPNPTKTEVSAFHLNNRQAYLELNVESEGVKLRHNPHPKYLGVTLDRTLTFRQHLKNVTAKVRTRTNVIQKLANTSWGANAETLRTSALALVYSAAEYCAPVWTNSHHTSLVDTQLNQAMRIITGTIRTTPTAWLPVLSNIAPPQIRRLSALKSQAEKIANNRMLPIHNDTAILTDAQPRLKSRLPAVRTASQLTNFSTEELWRTTWRQQEVRNSHLIEDPTSKVAGFTIGRRDWCNLNRIRTGHGICNKSLTLWGRAEDPSCDRCDAAEQSVIHMVLECPETRFEGSLQDIHNLTPTALEWLRASNLRL